LRAFVRAVRRLAPGLEPADFRRGWSGIRAQALDRQGNLLDDFHIVRGERAVHVLNAPSPAATAALAIGREIADRVTGRAG
jgi:L-2-hydroxyglutarate oxidase